MILQFSIRLLCSSYYLELMDGIYILNFANSQSLTLHAKEIKKPPRVKHLMPVLLPNCSRQFLIYLPLYCTGLVSLLPPSLQGQLQSN